MSPELSEELSAELSDVLSPELSPELSAALICAVLSALVCGLFSELTGELISVLLSALVPGLFSKLISLSITELSTITGQQAVSSKSKKDISNFKLRKNMPVGVRVTLRDNTMYEFLDRLISVALPRIRDFKGINDKGFDGRGNYTLGITEQIIFPEINIDKINKIQGMDITFVTSATNDVEALELLKQFGLPFKNQTR